MKNIKMANINILTNDCLRMVFEYLPIMDRIIVEKVCKRWRTLSKISWSSFKTLDFKGKTWTSEYLGEDTLYLQTYSILDKVIQLCGKYLICINIDITFHTDTIHFAIFNTDIQNICRQCPNVQEFVILIRFCITTKQICKSGQGHCKNKEHKIVPYLEPYCKRLTKFGFDFNEACDSHEEVVTFYKKMIKLKSFHFHRCPWLLGSHFELLNLPFDSLTEIRITNVNFQEEYPHSIKLLASKCVNLLSFSLGNVTNCDFDSAMDALLLHNNLKNLYINYSAICNSISVSGFKRYFYEAQLINLETLHLGHLSILDDELLKTIADKCKQITKLNIRACRNLTDTGISALSSLKRLRSLVMSCFGDYKRICPTWQKMNCLEELDCSRCFALQCNFFSDLVLNKAPNLRILNVTSCYNVNNELLTSALEAVKIRGDTKVLKIIAIDVDKTFYAYLKLVKSDLLSVIVKAPNVKRGAVRIVMP